MLPLATGPSQKWKIKNKIIIEKAPEFVKIGCFFKKTGGKHTQEFWVL